MPKKAGFIQLSKHHLLRTVLIFSEGESWSLEALQGFLKTLVEKHLPQFLGHPSCAPQLQEGALGDEDTTLNYRISDTAASTALYPAPKEEGAVTDPAVAHTPHQPRYSCLTIVPFTLHLFPVHSNSHHKVDAESTSSALLSSYFQPPSKRSKN